MKEHSSSGAARLLLVDDQVIFREGVRSIIQRENDLSVVGESSLAAPTVKLAHDSGADMILLELAMPDLGGAELTKILKAALPRVAILGLSRASERTGMEEALRAGADGCVLRCSPPEELLTAIRTVRSGGRYVPNGVDGLGAVPGSAPRRERKGASLSDRETEILRLIALSKTNKDIAVLLSISPKTVDKHRGRLMSKLGLHDIASLTRYAIANGYITLPV